MASVEGLDQLRRRLDAIGDQRQMLGTIALLAVSEAKALVPRRTGNLGRTIRVGRVTTTDAEVLAGGVRNVGYARHVEFGTQPHIIRPRRRKALRFAADAGGATLAGRPRAGAAVRFARFVRHPGTKAHPYLVPGVREALRKAGLRARIIDAWNRAA